MLEFPFPPQFFWLWITSRLNRIENFKQFYTTEEIREVSTQYTDDNKGKIYNISTSNRSNLLNVFRCVKWWFRVRVRRLEDGRSHAPQKLHLCDFSCTIWFTCERREYVECKKTSSVCYLLTCLFILPNLSLHTGLLLLCLIIHSLVTSPPL